MSEADEGKSEPKKLELLPAETADEIIEVLAAMYRFIPNPDDTALGISEVEDAKPRKDAREGAR